MIRCAKIFIFTLSLLACSAERQLPHIYVSDFFDVLKYGNVDDVAEVMRAARLPAEMSFEGIPLVMLAVLKEADADVIRFLADSGADVNAVYSGGITALMIAAARASDPDVIDALIEAGADLEAELDDGATAIVLAGKLNPNPETARRLRKPHTQKITLPRLLRRSRKFLRYAALRLLGQFF